MKKKILPILLCIMFLAWMIPVTPAMAVPIGGIITTIAGNGTAGYTGDNGAAKSAELNYPAGMAVDASGNIYIADHSNSCIRKVDTGGTITTVAGTGTPGYSGDGDLAISAELQYPTGVAVDTNGNVYIADYNNRIREVAVATGTQYGIDMTAGDIYTIAGSGATGNGAGGYWGDGGPATSAGLNSPRGVAVDAVGNIYIGDVSNKRVRMVDTSGTITTVAGNGQYGYSGDKGPALNAELTVPWGVAVDTSGNLYIADEYNNRIRKVDTFGTITTVAGTGNARYSGDKGPATSAGLMYPIGVAVDTSGNIYIADTSDNRIRKVDTSGTITTVAGGGSTLGDGGPSLKAKINAPSGVALDTAGNMYIADTNNNRVREVTKAMRPTVTGISSTGGTSITITGTSFTDAADVYFGTADVTSSKFTVVNDTTITVVPPAGAGTVDITVATIGGTSAVNADDQFSYPPLFDGGSGTQGDPFQIATAAELNNIRQVETLPYYYEQTADIDLSSYGSTTSNTTSSNQITMGWDPIGDNLSENPFKGNFSGHEHTISNLYINDSSGNLQNAGLFGCIDSSATVAGVTLDNAEITSEGYYVNAGALAGENDGTVSSCGSTGASAYVVGSETGSYGGLVGYNAGKTGTASITDSYATGNINGIAYIGGLVGYNDGYGSTASIANCYATGSVTSTDSNTCLGGLAGCNDGDSGTASIANCYATGSVTGTTSNGGLVGYNTNDGGAATIDSSYWDTITTGQSSASGVENGVGSDTSNSDGNGMATTLMQTQATFVGWDFTNIWEINEGSSYPYLLGVSPSPPQAQTATPVITTPVYVGATSVNGTAVPGANISLTVNNGTAQTTTADTSGDWAITGLTLAANDTISVTAQVTGDAVSNPATYTVINKSTLESAITNANSLIASVTVGTTEGDVLQTDHDTYQAAIDVATVVDQNADATQDDIDAAVLTLANATTVFNGDVIPAPTPVTGVSISNSVDTITLGHTDQLTATVAPNSATNKTVAWSSDNTSVATVDQTGMVTAVKEGSANIIVRTDDGDFTATCTVTVSLDVGVRISPSRVDFSAAGVPLHGVGGPAYPDSVEPDSSNINGQWTSGIMTVTLLSGSLPAGLICSQPWASWPVLDLSSLDPNTGVVNGLEVGTFVTTWDVEDPAYNNGEGASGTWQITFDVHPVVELDSISPTSGCPGTVVTLTGSGFNDPCTDADYQILFNGSAFATNVSPVSGSGGTEMTAVVPSIGETSAVDVTVSNVFNEYNAPNASTLSGGFTYTQPPPPTVTITISPSTLPDGTVGTAYNQTLTATDGITDGSTYSFGVTSGNLPTDLTLSADGVLSGTPTTTGTYDFTVTATANEIRIGIPLSESPPSGTQSYALTVNAAVTPTPSNSTIDPITATFDKNTSGTDYVDVPVDVTSAGTVTSIMNGGTPLTQDTDYTVSGSVYTILKSYLSTQSVGTTTLTFDFSAGAPATLAVIVEDTTPAPAPPTGTITISPNTLPDGTVGTAYLQTLTASGGTAPSVDESVYGSVYDQIVPGLLVYTFSIDGNLPDGLALSSGSIQGTPTTSGSFPFTVNVTDNNNEAGSQPYVLTVSPEIVPVTIIGLAVTPSTMSLIVARQGSAVATAVYSDTSTANVTKLATWTSSNDKIATVNAGQITAVSSGTATITATYEGQSGSTTVTVTAPVVSSGGGAVTPVAPITPVIPPVVPVVPVVPVIPIVPVVLITPVAPVAPIVPVAPVTLLPSGTHSSTARTNIVPVTTSAVVPTPVVAPVVTPVVVAPIVVPIVTPAPVKRSPVPPVVPVVGGLAILGVIAALIQKRSYAALLLLLPFRVASIGISSQFVGLAAISLAFDDTKRKPSRVTVDVFKANGSAIAKGVVVTRGQSTNIGFPVMGLGEKTRLTVKARGYRNTSKNKSVDIPVR
jgi:uncharacterized protein YjdB